MAISLTLYLSIEPFVLCLIENTDELKSHLFSIHFSDLFLYKKTDLYAGIWNKLHQIYVQQESQKKA